MENACEVHGLRQSTGSAVESQRSGDLRRTEITASQWSWLTGDFYLSPDYSCRRLHVPPIAIDSDDKCADYMITALTFHAETKARNDGWRIKTIHCCGSMSRRI